MDNDNNTGCGSLSGIDKQICDQCQKINLSLAFSAWTLRFELRDRMQHGNWISDLGTLSATCEMCRLFKLMTSSFEGNFENYQLCAFPSPNSFYVPKRIPGAPRSEFRVLLQPVPSTGSRLLETASSIIPQLPQHGWVACWPSENISGMFRPQSIPGRFNAALVKRWLSTCGEYHERTCSISVHVPELVLIDCETQLLCLPSERTLYVALSYVCGDKRSRVETDTKLDNLRLPPATSLPKVVQDAISVTLQLGFRYLWVNKYCVNQSDPAVRQAQIHNMGLIYQRAELTIIAAAGESEEYGLPGVASERARSLTIESGSHTVAHVPPEPFWVRRNSKWATRGWTFQEEFFSSRRLYFSEWHVFYVCQTMICCEGLGGAGFVRDRNDMKTYEETSQVAFRSRMFAFMTKPSDRHTEDENDRVQRLWSLISDYSCRFLTYPADILTSFAGICRDLEDGSYPIHSVQGLPIGVSPEHDSSNYFVHSLCWDHTDVGSSVRKAEFPSWTWIGWNGGIYFPRDIDASTNFEINARLVSLEYEYENMITFQEVVKILRSLHKEWLEEGMAQEQRATTTISSNLASPKAIRITAPSITADFFSFAEPEKWGSGKLLGGNIVKVVPPRKDSMLLSPRDFLYGLKAENLACVLLGVDVPYSKSVGYTSEAHFLILQWNGETEVQRIGKLRKVNRGTSSMDLDGMIKLRRMSSKSFQLV